MVKCIMLKPKVGFTVTYHPLEVGAEAAPKLFSEYYERMTALDLEAIKADEPIHNLETAVKTGKVFRENQVDVICILLATWSSDELVLDLLEEWSVPVIVWGLPRIHTGSLCGAQQINCVLKELNKH